MHNVALRSCQYFLSQSLALSTAALQRREGKRREPKHRRELRVYVLYAGWQQTCQLVWNKDIF